MTKKYFQNLRSKKNWQLFENFPNFFRNFEIFIFQIDFSKKSFSKKKLPNFFSATFFFENFFFEKSIWKMKILKFQKKFGKFSKFCQLFFRSNIFSMKNNSIEKNLLCISIPNFPKIPKIALRKFSDELGELGAKSRSKVYKYNLFFAELFIFDRLSPSPLPFLKYDAAI